MQELGGPQSGEDNIGWTAEGEWLEYTVNVVQSGEYFLAVSGSSGGDA
jgi:hypothetical protein